MEGEDLYPRLQITVGKWPGFSNIGSRAGILLKFYFKEGDKRRSIQLHKRLFETGDTKSAVEIRNVLINGLSQIIGDKAKIENGIMGDRHFIIEDYSEESKQFFINILDDIQHTVPVVPYKPVIIKLNEKHGDRYFIAKDPDHAKKVWLHILQMRYDEKEYEWMKRYTNSKIKPEFTQKEIDNLPDSMIEAKKQMQTALKVWEKAEKEVDEYLLTYNEIEQALINKNGIEAFNLLSEFKQGEYEGFEIIDSEEIE